MSTTHFTNPEPMLGTLARLFAADGAAKEVAILAYSKPEMQETGYDSWNGGTTIYTLYLYVPIHLYPQIQEQIATIEQSIYNKTNLFLGDLPNDTLAKVKIVPSTVDDSNWRDKAVAWLNGEKINNQGRVRSDNVAPLTCDGLLFRSQPEILLYRALKAKGVSFAPLPVFIRGGENYSRIEPDFVVIYSGIMMFVEVDGDTVHHETPAEAQARLRTLQHEGVHVERISASECNTLEKAATCADKIISSICAIKSSR